MNRTYCLFSANYLPNIGGVERYTYNLAKYLIKRGNRVIVVTSNVFSLKTHEMCGKIEIYRLPCYNLLKGRFPVIKGNKEFHEISKKLKSIPIDLIIVNTRFYVHSLYGVWLANQIKVKSIVIEHGTGHLTIKNRVMDKIGQGFEHFHTKLVKHYCKDFYGVSEACNKWSAHFGIQSKGVLYNAVDLVEINELLDQTKENYRNKYLIDQEDVIITFTGRLVKEKGILNLIEAIKKINQNKKFNPKVHLFIAGTGPLLERISEMLEDNIYLLGQLNFVGVIALLKESDIFCLPSESEGFPTSVLEAVACHCYIVTTERGGAKELIISDEYGCILKNNSTEVLMDTILKLINQKEYRENTIKLSYKRLEKYFTWDTTANNVESLLKDG
ncbi:MAG: glycosyltransferase family 4 protein [Eubacterium sp.]